MARLQRGPDKDVLIGPNFKPFHEHDRGADPGVKTWPRDMWKIGGGTRPDTGEAIRAYQYMPHDDDDYDGGNENVLLDLNIKGRMRKVLAHPDRNGRVYFMDRATGEVLSAEAFVFINTTEYVDLKTGIAKVSEDKKAGFKTARNICPAAHGTAVYSAHQSLPGFSGNTGELHLRHAICGSDHEDVCGTGGGNPGRGRDVIQYYGCPACHTISGVPNAHELVGPPLTGFASRVYIAGMLPNTTDNLMHWIENPKKVNERTAMPNMNVTATDARDIAGYLYTLK